jgi:ADP-heptose:LPS heptosyltransferase
MKILIIKQTSLGDVLHGTVSLPMIKARYPDAEIHFLTDRNSLPIVHVHPQISRLILTDFGSWQGYWIRRFFFVAGGVIRTFKELRKEKYDLAFDLQGRFRTVLYLYAARATEKWIKGNWPFLKGFRNKHLHAIQEMKNVLALAGIFDTQPPAKTHFEIDKEAVEKIAKQYSSQEHLVVINPYTGWPSKNWPLSHYETFLKTFPSGYRVLVTGEKSRQREIETLCLRVNRQDITSLAGKLNLNELAALVKRAQLLVSGEGFLVHLATAFETPVVVFFGPTLENRIGPTGRSHAILRAENCRGCYRPRCSKKCLTRISPEVAIKYSTELLGLSA